ncbi:cysteine proteinase [Hypoxylon trugodes]|uniref:cysteine proteinase n=1 Tax=Hypoxylon trugodes TaxID=326681 RepID=UPI0021922B67|nr:cysteine proteinase [Hypoxylon trugodes]KAI1385745.1 cysteine proteinase [Hypoxylon trugodes]
MDFIYPLDDVAELHRLQQQAKEDVRTSPNPRVVTSPLLLSQFLGSQIPELDSNHRCSNHEMLLVITQSSEGGPAKFISTFCGRCHYHFHIMSDSRHVQPYSNDTHRLHMLVPCGQDSTHDSGVNRTGYDDAIGNVRYICAADGCFFNIKISSIPERISEEEMTKLDDKNRIAHNFAQAQANDPERYEKFGDISTLKPRSILQKYLADGLDRDSQQPRLRVNKRNKKFLVCMGNDFDNLLKFLGFCEGVDAESDEPCWFIVHPEPKQGLTRVRTLRARMEDAMAELGLVNGVSMNPAWDSLLNAFQGSYQSVPLDFNAVDPIPDAEFALLGCLAGYPPRSFAWAAIFLAQLRPKDRDKYLDTALRCIKERSDDASTEIIMYRSRFDETVLNDRIVEEAFTFFAASPEDGLKPEWFLERYYEMVAGHNTDKFRAEAQQHLEAIGNHLGRDIVSEINPRALENVGDMGLIISSPNGGRMDIASATKLLGVESNWTAEIIRGFVGNLANDPKTDRNKLVEAIDVLSEFKRQNNEPEEAAELQNIAQFVKESGYVPTLVSQPHSSPQPTGSVNTPPGLKNIGNTCYLNSLLQYFYNVKVVRDLVLNFDDFKLELDEEIVAQRKTGGNGTSVNLEEAIVARQFVEMLQGLFADLQTTTNTAAQPSQKLANTALSSARDILDQQSNTIPPPLPARPSPAPLLPSRENDDAMKGVTNDAIRVSVESVNDKHELASSQSSHTLVDEVEDTRSVTYDPSKTPNDGDVKMHDYPESLALDDKIAEVSRRLEHSDRSGTSQQDVGEIIGNILEHIMRAIRSDGPMPEKPELQADKITQTFFTTIVNYTIKTKKGYPASNPASYLEESPLNIEIVPERWITAYPEEADQPSDGPSTSFAGPTDVRCTLTAALDRYFSYEPIDEEKRARYSSIRSLPPIVHICIQRSTPKGKNKNPVIIPEILYLDRYMEAGKDSAVWNARKRAWALKERLKELRATTSKVILPPIQSITESEEFKNAEVEDLATMTSAAVGNAAEEAGLQEAFLDDMGSDKKRKLAEPFESSLLKKIATPASSVSFPLSDKFGDLVWDISKPLNEMTEKEVTDLNQKEETIFGAMNKEKYNIHAVICHRGGTAAGHYWVWIRDFQRNVWYRYNDETVTEDGRDTDAVLKDLNETGDPYYVAYVRDELKEDLVDVPQRHKREPEGSPTGGEEVEMIEGVTVEETQPPLTNGHLSN